MCAAASGAAPGVAAVVDSGIASGLGRGVAAGGTGSGGARLCRARAARERATTPDGRGRVGDPTARSRRFGRVADAADRADGARRPELGAQLGDVHVDGARAGGGGVAPDRAEQLLAA